MTFFAILFDSFREAWDRNILRVLLALNLVFGLMSAAIGFKYVPIKELTAKTVEDISTFRMSPHAMFSGYQFSLVEVSGGPGVDVDQPPRGGEEILFTIMPAQENSVERVVRWWNEPRARGLRGDAADAPADDIGAFLRRRLGQCGLDQVTVEPAESLDPKFPRFRVRARLERLHLINFAARVTAFGYDLPEGVAPVMVALFVYGLQSTLAKLLAGFIGMLVALIVTAGFVPAMLEKGAIDIVLCKPVSRPALALSKFMGSLIFVAVNAGILVIAAWLPISIRSGFWNWAFLWTLPMLVAYFAILYSVSFLAGVLFRTPMVSLIATLGLWLICTILGTVNEFAILSEHAPGWAEPPRAEMDGGPEADKPAPPEEKKGPGIWLKTARVLYYIFPKTGDLATWCDHIQLRRLPPRVLEGIPGAFVQKEIDYGMVAWTSALFTAVMVGIAVAVFWRRDY